MKKAMPRSWWSEQRQLQVGSRLVRLFAAGTGLAAAFTAVPLGGVAADQSSPDPQVVVIPAAYPYNINASKFVQAVETPNTTVRVAGDVNLDLSGYEYIVVAPGVQIIGDRSVLPKGPMLFTTTFPRKLFQVGDDYHRAISDNVRISGIRLDGGMGTDAFSAVGTDGADAIDVESSRNVEIDHSEIFGWRGSAVVVQDTQNRIDRESASTAWIHDNYLHHNQHPTGDLLGGGHGAGYGVVSSHGAYALIEKNVFDYNRHAIAGGADPGTGYLAYRNLILPHGGINTATTHTHAIDMHGSADCGVFGSYNCGDAGEYMDVEYNTILYTAGTGIKLRGRPSVGMTVERNVFAHEHAWESLTTHGAMDETLGVGITASDNTFGLNSYDDSGFCDFDGDNEPDRFFATGATWWYLATSLDNRWVYLNQSGARRADVTLTDLNHDGYCDVSAAGIGYITANPASSRAVARNADGRMSVFVLDAQHHLLYRSQLAAGVDTWSAWKPLGGTLASVAAEADGRGQIEVFGVDDSGKIFHRWQLTSNSDTWSAWAEFGGTLSSAATAISVTRTSDGGLSVFGVTAGGLILGRSEYAAPGGADAGRWSGWVQIDGSLAGIAAETNANGQIELFGMDGSGKVLHRWETIAGSGVWSAWTEFGGMLPLRSTIAVTRGAGGALALFATNGVGQVFGRSQFDLPGSGGGGRWSAWGALDGTLFGIAADTNSDGRIELVGADRAGVVDNRQEVAPGTGVWTPWTTS